MSEGDIRTSIAGTFDSRADLYTKRKPGGVTPPPVETFNRITGDGDARITGDSDNRVIGH